MVNFLRNLWNRWLGFEPVVYEAYAKPGCELQPMDLAAIVCYFNPQKYKSRKLNFEKFYQNFQRHYSRVPLLVVELEVAGGGFELEGLARTIRLSARDVLWHKERLLNIGIEKLIQEGFKNIAWLDGDILFSDPYWPERLVVELESKSVCQLFSQSVREEEGNLEFSARRGVVREFLASGKVKLQGLSCGYGWAARARVLQQVPLYEATIMGGGDAAFWLATHLYGDERAWFAQVEKTNFYQSLGEPLRAHYVQWARKLGAIVRGEVGFVPQKMMSLYHGKLKNRLYGSRYLMIPEFNPEVDLERSATGCWQWRTEAKAKVAVQQYFALRKEDEKLNS